MYDDRDPRLICPSLAPYGQYCFVDAGRVIGDLYCNWVVEGLIIPAEYFEEGVAEVLRSIGEGAVSGALPYRGEAWSRAIGVGGGSMNSLSVAVPA